MTIITRTNGQPFATESSARQQLTAKGLQGTHEVVPHEGGYALVPKKTTPKHKFKVGDRVRVNGHRNGASGHEYGTNRTIRNWHKERTLLEVKSIPISTKVYAGKPGFNGNAFAFHVSELDLVEDAVIDTADPITLQPGDHVSTEGMTEEQYHAVARAFMEAGAEKSAHAPKWTTYPLLGWDARDGTLYAHREHLYKCWTGRHLTIDQVLGAANAGNATPKPEETSMPTNPITTLKQARQARDEAEQAYQESLEEVREYLGQGFELIEVGIDAASADQFRKAVAAATQIPERMLFGDVEEDMTDPANWREGDVVECVFNYYSGYEQGKLYELYAPLEGGRVGVIGDDDDQYEMREAKSFRFHHRPN